jgi:hypothetical protein
MRVEETMGEELTGEGMYLTPSHMWVRNTQDFVSGLVTAWH